MLPDNMEYRLIKPSRELADVVSFFWMVANHSEQEKEVVVLPDARFDIIFTRSETEPFHAFLTGLTCEAGQNTIPPKSIMFAVSFKLLAAEYLLDTTIAEQFNQISFLPEGYWDIRSNDLNDFDHFCEKISVKMIEALKENVDERKRKLFDLIYAQDGGITVAEISETIGWSSRQMNRYFTTYFGLSLKTYCNLLRYRASFPQIKEGKLFPEHNYVDQAHFIREVKKYSGVTPKELARNDNGRFIHFVGLPMEELIFNCLF